MKKIKVIILSLSLASMLVFIVPLKSGDLIPPKSEQKIFKYKDGTQAVVNDGDPCQRIYEENDNGDFDLVETNCR